MSSRSRRIRSVNTAGHSSGGVHVVEAGVVVEHGAGRLVERPVAGRAVGDHLPVIGGLRRSRRQRDRRRVAPDRVAVSVGYEHAVLICGARREAGVGESDRRPIPELGVRIRCPHRVRRVTVADHLVVQRLVVAVPVRLERHPHRARRQRDEAGLELAAGDHRALFVRSDRRDGEPYEACCATPLTCWNSPPSAMYCELPRTDHGAWF